MFSPKLGIPWTCYRCHLGPSGPKLQTESENEFLGPLGPGAQKSKTEPKNRNMPVDFDSFLTLFKRSMVGLVWPQSLCFGEGPVWCQGVCVCARMWAHILVTDTRIERERKKERERERERARERERERERETERERDRERQIERERERQRDREREREKKKEKKNKR